VGPRQRGLVTSTARDQSPPEWQSEAQLVDGLVPDNALRFSSDDREGERRLLEACHGCSGSAFHSLTLGENGVRDMHPPATNLEARARDAQ
jgi:hypothetical protein